MSKYGLKIKIYQAGSVYEADRGVRTYYDARDAMLCNSLFLDFIKDNGLNIYKEESTRDIICVEFKYGASSYEEARKKLVAKMADAPDEKLPYYKERLEAIAKIEPQFDKKSKEDLRTLFYEEGLNIRYGEDEVVHYRMLYRTPGKAKKGSVMFIRDELYPVAREFLYMGYELPQENAPIVEVGAYSSLITSTIEARICILPENILIISDFKSFMRTNVVSIETDEERRCHAVPREDYELCNTMFDGQALIDESIFPEWANGYVLLRQHFTKCAAFCTRIQLFFKDYFGKDYESAEVVDFFGNKHAAKDVRLITTTEAVKWLKFPSITYDHWCERVRANGSMWGVVKTAHQSKLGDVQRMSYQMVNALRPEIMDDVSLRTRDYIYRLKTEDATFLEYLEHNRNFSNDYDVMAAICRENPEFVCSEYFRDRKERIIGSYMKNMKLGRLIQNADNLVIVGSPYAMLLHAVGEDPESDPTFEREAEATQCWTERFKADEYLAAFRSPLNSQNNVDYLHNVYHEYFTKYFDLGRLIIAVNMNHTGFQSRNNGSDQILVAS